VVTLTAIPKNGYQFLRWSGNLSGNTNPATITMDENKQVTAVFSGTGSGSGSSGGSSGGYSPPSEFSVVLTGFDSKSSLVTNSSGSVLSAAHLISGDGLASLDIPQGVVLKNSSGSRLKTLTMDILSSTFELPADNTLCACYGLGPEGASFNPPITFNVKFDPSALSAPDNAENLYLAYWDGSQWLKLDSQLDSAGQTVSSQIDHFSQYALFEKLPPAEFVVSNLIFIPAEVDSGMPVVIQAAVSNTGGSRGVYPLILKINGVEEDSWDVALPAGQSENCAFLAVRKDPGEYLVDVNGLTGQFKVLDLKPVVVLSPAPEKTTNSLVNTTPDSLPDSFPSPSPEVTAVDEARSIPLQWIFVAVFLIAVLISVALAIRRKVI
jgi:hypothetical protein